jgi:TRAP-type mannitol/chloroaromatic compound transport system permease small subunit
MQAEDPSGPDPQAESAARGPYGRLLFALAKWFAYGGGAVFIALVIMSVVSIVGRKLLGAPVPGDVEVLQLSAAFASATFFAYCHLMRGDVKVDFFTAHMSSGRRVLLDSAGSLLVGLLGAVLAWRTAVGAMSLKEGGESSAILELPVWIAQALMVPSFVLLALAGFYMCWYPWSRSRGKS